MAGERKRFFSHLVTGLKKTRKAVVYDLDGLFNGPGEMNDGFYDELEEILIVGDVGARTTEKILEELRAVTEERHVRARSVCRGLLIENIKSRMDLDENAYNFEKTPSVLLLIGVSGVGKTTTAGKMAAQAEADGRRVLLAGTDTFHAAVTEQLGAWSQRAGVEVVKATAGADPTAVVFDTCQASRARHTDLLICGTAGRLHNEKNLMEELREIDRVVQRELPEHRRETLLALDGTAGQSTIEQVKEFGDICGISGVVLTKLDGSTKGDVAIAVRAESKLPVKYIGVGERIDNLRRFDAGQYVEVLFAREPNRESEEETQAVWNR